MTKMASDGQKGYIATLLKQRAGNPTVCGDIDKVRLPIPHIDFRDDMPVETWIDQMTFEEAKACLTYLVTLPEPPPADETPITDQQRSKIWAVLKALGYSTWNCWKLREDDRDIPYLGPADWEMKIWDWISSLSKAQANEVIEHLEETQKIAQGH